MIHGRLPVCSCSMHTVAGFGKSSCSQKCFTVCSNVYQDHYTSLSVGFSPALRCLYYFAATQSLYNFCVEITSFATGASLMSSGEGLTLLPEQKSRAGVPAVVASTTRQATTTICAVQLVPSISAICASSCSSGAAPVAGILVPRPASTIVLTEQSSITTCMFVLLLQLCKV